MKSLVTSSSLAFWSYTRTDDRFLGGALTRLRERLELGVRVFTGEPRFKILQDVEIRPGIDSLGILHEMLAKASILIPIVTPLYFRSRECRKELETFLH